MQISRVRLSRRETRSEVRAERFLGSINSKLRETRRGAGKASSPGCHVFASGSRAAPYIFIFVFSARRSFPGAAQRQLGGTTPRRLGITCKVTIVAGDKVAWLAVAPIVVASCARARGGAQLARERLCLRSRPAFCSDAPPRFSSPPEALSNA